MFHRLFFSLFPGHYNGHDCASFDPKNPPFFRSRSDHRTNENRRFSLWKILMIFSMIFLMIHKISYYTARVSTGGVETRWLG